MLRVTIPSIEKYDESNNMFIYSKEYVLNLEHSLVSISKWESKWKKAFLTKTTKTIEETIDYVRCMNDVEDIDNEAYNLLTNANLSMVKEYIDADMTATKFSKANGNRKINRDVITSEIVYYWMIALNIPFECQRWHLNRLLTLIDVCNVKNSPPKKMSRQEVASQNSSLNAERKKTLTAQNGGVAW